MERFCDNESCPNYDLKLNEESHYHNGEADFVGGNCGILRSHKVTLMTNPEFFKTKLKFSNQPITETTYTIKEYRFCDICHNMIGLIKGEKNE